MAGLEGKKLGEFEVISKLGEGGMGLVFLGRQPSLGRQVAIKTLWPQFAANDRFVERFHREANAAALLNHPNIIQVYTAGVQDGLHYIAMEYVPGKTLREKIDRHGRLEPVESIAICVHVVQALKYAWDRAQIIHRDIKPENILISNHGEVKVADLGLAKQLGEAATGATMSGVSMGSPHYISPEQARSAKDVDFRTDIYSLGCTLFHMLSGQPPYEGDDPMGVMFKHVSEPMPDILSRVPNCPAPVVALLRKMLAKERDKRYRSYDELLADLLATHDRITAASFAPVKQRDPMLWYAGAASVAIVAIVGLLIWAPWKSRNAPAPAPGRTGVAPRETTPQPPVTAAKPPLTGQTKTQITEPAGASTPQPDDDANWGPWEELFDGKALGKWRVAKEGKFRDNGQFKVQNGEIRLQKSGPSALEWTAAVPTTDFELSLDAMRTAGAWQLCGFALPIGANASGLLLVGYEGKAGFDHVDDKHIRENPDARRVSVNNGTWYRIRVRVTTARVVAWLDDNLIIDQPIHGHVFSLSSRTEGLKPLALLWSTSTEAAFRNIRLRRLKVENADEWTTLPNGWRVGKPENLGPAVNSASEDLGPCVSADSLTLLFASRRIGNRDMWVSTRRSMAEPWGTAARFGPPISTSAEETDPCLSGDGLTLYFSSNRPGGHGGNDLWMSTRRNATAPWGAPENLGPTVNRGSDDAEPSVATDGLTLIFTSDRPDGLGGRDLWMCTRPDAAARWGAPTNLGPTVNNKADDFFPCLSGDALVLFFTSERAGGQGNQDLWMSTRRSKAEPFGEPVNLGPKLNTMSQERDSALSADGRTLYFASLRPGGRGNYDLYQAPLLPPEPADELTTLPNGWRVGKPVNLGPIVNSDKIEGSPAASADGLTLLFHSNRPGTQGGRALWMCRRQRTSEPWGPPINLGQGVNSGTRDTDACLAPDELTLWFASTRPGGQGGNDLWMCTRRAATDPCGQPVNLGPTVNSRHDDGDPWVSADALTLTFSSERPGGQGGSDLWISTRRSVSQPWQTPVNLGPRVNSSAQEFCACLSPDGLALIFDSERSRGQGSRDLWMCTRRSTSEPFGEAVNFGAPVSTANSDGGPSLSADGRTLYFHSDRPGGTGDFDLWQAPLLPPDAEATLRADGLWIGLFHSPAELAECEQSGSVRLENGTLHLSGEGSVRVPLGAQDVIVRAKIKRVSGPHLSLRLRLSQPRGRHGVNGYAAVLKEKSCSVDVTKSSAWNALAVGRTTTTQPNEYTEVLFSAVGNTLILYIDGKSVIETQREVELFSGDLAIAVSEGEAMVRDVAIQVLDKGWTLPDWMKLATAAQLDDDTRWRPWEDLFDGKTLEGWRVAEGGPGGVFNGHGDVTVANGHLLLGQGKKLTGLSWTGEFPTTNYEIRCRAMRREGGREGECCSLVFPVGDSFAELSVGGWYNSCTGIQCVDGMRGNNTPHMRKHGVETGVWHDIRVRVTDARLQAWVDGAPIADLARAEHKFSPDSYSEPCLPFGLWYGGAEGVVQSVRLRRLKAGGTGAMKASAWKVYTEWPFDDSEAKRRQVETATALGVPVHQDIDLGNGVKMAMVLIPAGEFLMGSAPTTSPQQLQATYGGSLRDYERELPQHRVRISKPFWLGKYEVTQEQWQCVFQNNPSANKNQPKNPVENVELKEADDFIKALSTKLGKTFRLPAEAEWEYACRAGTTSEFYFGDDAAKLAEFGWVRAGSPAPVGQKTPNAWGLYDMMGNVWEWCGDWFGKYEGTEQTDPTGALTGSMRVLRGGSWNYARECSRTAFRHLFGAGGRNPGNGLRVVLVPELPAGGGITE